MKLSEAIDRLEVGETVWVKATVDRINNEGKYIRAMSNASSVYLDGNDEISLTEPQAEKVEAHLAVHWNEDVGDVLWWNFPVEEPPYCGTPLDEHFPKYKTHFTTIDMPNEIEQPKRWVVKCNWGTYFKQFTGVETKGTWVNHKRQAYNFTNRKKAEAVALLFNGSVEEVAE